MSSKELPLSSLNQVVECLSPERLLPYLHSVPSGELQEALALYQWNISISGAFHEAISIAEVCLRNTLHNQMTRLTQDEPGNWLENSTLLLTADAQKEISVAQRRVTHKGGPLTPARLVSELNFGFWRYLLAKRYETTLWTPALRHGFPQFQSQQRKIVYNVVTELHILRNRIAHHEPIFKRDLRQDFVRIYQLIEWISPQTREWSTPFSRVKETISQYPRFAAK